MNNNKQLFIIAAIAIAFVLGFTACKSSKEASSSMTSAPLRSLSHTAIDDFKEMTSGYAAWTDVSMPVKVNVTRPKNLSVSGTLSMNYGRSVALTMKMFFIEAASLYADNDSVLIVSKPMGVYYTESMAKFQEAFGLSLSDLQSLVLGQACEPGKGAATEGSAKVFNISEYQLGAGLEDFFGVEIAPKKAVKGLNWKYIAVSPNDAALGLPRLFSVNIEQGAHLLSAEYSKSVESEAGLIASKMQVQGRADRFELAAEVSLTPGRASWNTGTTPKRPNIPFSAKRISTEQIYNIIKSI